MKLEHEEVRVRVLNWRPSGRSARATCSWRGRATGGDRGVQRAGDAARRGSWQQRDGVDIRYYSIIYDVSDDIEKLVRGKVAPKARENFLGYAEIRKVFDITKTGQGGGLHDHRGPGEAWGRGSAAAGWRCHP